MHFHHATAISPAPSGDWVALSDAERIAGIDRSVQAQHPVFKEQLTVVSARHDGQVIVRLAMPLGPSDRGTLLMDFEDFLKQAVDQGITVWGESLGDKNSLRNLRGIEVKS
jgi:hypothetical protein